MTPFQSLILGIIQGLTEFLPVSSTAHLLIGQKLLGIPASDATFSFLVIIQLGTILSLIIFFGKELWNIIKSTISNLRGLKDFPSMPFDARLGWYILLATIPALIIGLLFKDMVKLLFANQLQEASIRLLTAAIIMSLAEFLSKRSRQLDSITWLDGLFIGLMQIISVFPGASRSGTTISAGLMRNFDRPSAARFAFLMAVPVMLAAGVYESIGLIHMPGLAQFLPVLIIGFISAAIIGWFAIRWFMGYLGKHSLHFFALYCLILGLICLLFAI
jgi:undecaprenyl-diphosphatase